MMKKFFSIALVAVVAATFVSTTASASPSNAFSLKNNGNKDLHFSYRCIKPFTSDYQVETIKAGDNYDYWETGCKEYEVEKTTSYDDDSERTFHYTLQPGKQYELAWDADKNAWDFHVLGHEDVAFHLKNSSNMLLHFNMRCTSPTTQMEAQTIPAGKMYDFWLDGCSEYEVVKSTDYDDSSTKTFRYTLQPNKYYKLRWDGDKNAWNVFECNDSDCS